MTKCSFVWSRNVRGHYTYAIHVSENTTEAKRECMLLSTELDGVINKEIISREKMKKELNKKKKIKSE